MNYNGNHDGRRINNMVVEFTYHAKQRGIERLHTVFNESINVYEFMNDCCKSFFANPFVSKYFRKLKHNKYRYRVCHHRATGVPVTFVFVIEIINNNYVRVINFFVELNGEQYASFEFKGYDETLNLWLYPDYFRFETPNGTQTWI